MIKRTATLSLLIGLALTAPASAEVWDVIEGTTRPSRGAWNMNLAGGVISGTGEMVDDKGKRSTFAISGAVTGRQFTVQRAGANGGPSCLYRGDMNQSGKISGSVTCGQNTTAWFVTRR